jgi:hypothetical protein
MTVWQENIMLDLLLSTKTAATSYLRKAYRNMDLHTDGTYVKEVTDWLLMTKIDEQNAEGGETAMLHLDDLGTLRMIYTMIQSADKTLLGDHQKVKMWIIK